MAEVIGVRFKNTGKVYYFDPQGEQVEKGSMAIVETARGMECGEIAMANREVADESIVQPLRKLVRLATPEDLKKVAENHIKEKKAFKACEKKIAERSELSFDSNVFTVSLSLCRVESICLLAAYRPPARLI